MKEIIGSAFNAEQSQFAVIDIWADWCMPCKKMMPTFEKVAGEFSEKVDFYKADVMENTDFAAKYGISAVPSLLFFKDGQLSKRVVGLQSEDSIRKLVNELVS